MNDLAPKILGNLDASDAAPALQKILLAVDATTILALTDARGTILYVNDRFCEISKYTREELVGENHRILHSGYHSRSFFLEMWRTIASGKTWNGEIKNKAKDGSYYWVETAIVPFLDDNGKPHRYAAIRKEITDKKSLSEQIELEKAKAMSSEKMAALGEMAAGIAHEVGNPLGALRGRVEMLKMKAESGEVSEEEVVKASDVILGLVDRTTKIIKGLRSYARDASKDPFEQVGVQLMVTGILDFSQSRLKKWNIQVTKEFEGKEISAFCRESEIGQVLVNLINNACDVLKDIEKRDLIIRVFSEKKTHTKEVVIQVENSGPKIPEEIQMRVFEPFFTTKAAGSGTGLGLSISSRIMQAHQGSLSLVDKDQTCFELRWPVHLE